MKYKNCFKEIAEGLLLGAMATAIVSGAVKINDIGTKAYTAGEGGPMEKLTEQEMAQALSIGAYNQPVNPDYAGTDSDGNNIFYFFRDDDGKLYYISESTLQFDREMEEAQRKRHGKQELTEAGLVMRRIRAQIKK